MPWFAVRARPSTWEGQNRFPEEFSQGVQPNHMTSKLVRFLMASVFAFSVSALAQTGASPDALPAAPSAASAPAAAPVIGSKIGVINVEGAIYACNEGQRDFSELQKKLEPKETQLKGENEELDALKKQLSAQGDKLSSEAHDNLVRQIDVKQKSLDRAMQDFRDDGQTQQSEIGQRILQKMGPVLVKYAAENGFGLLIDISKQWPDGPVIWNGGSIDITRAVIQAYNVQSGVAAPAAKPAAPRSGAGGAAAKPTTPAK
jgi:outer membrane protein